MRHPIIICIWGRSSPFWWHLNNQSLKLFNRFITTIRLFLVKHFFQFLLDLPKTMLLTFPEISIMSVPRSFPNASKVASRIFLFTTALTASWMEIYSLDCFFPGFAPIIEFYGTEISTPVFTPRSIFHSWLYCEFRICRWIPARQFLRILFLFPEVLVQYWHKSRMMLSWVKFSNCFFSWNSLLILCI